jgi:hypothetical protein
MGRTHEKQCQSTRTEMLGEQGVVVDNEGLTSPKASKIMRCKSREFSLPSVPRHP